MKVRRLLRDLRDTPYRVLDRLYLPMDQRRVRRSGSLCMIPPHRERRGGKSSYIEWGYTIGMFQSLLTTHLHSPCRNRILDVGCGAGLLALASKTCIADGGSYVGIDVNASDVEACKKRYTDGPFRFVHHKVSNAYYSPEYPENRLSWQLDDLQFDAVTALSVWTHFDEQDARFYLTEVGRVLKPLGMAFISCFMLDSIYEASIPHRQEAIGRFHRSIQSRWIFDQSVRGSAHWYTPSWTKTPEHAIGIKVPGLLSMIESSGLKIVRTYLGTWKEVPGLYFQDVLVLQKPA